MPPAKKHSDMQKSVCTVCFRKTGRMIPISKKLQITVQEAILPGYGSDDWAWLPSVICSGCYKELYTFKHDAKHTLKHVDFTSLNPPIGHGQPGFPHTRSQQVQAASPCTCSVCYVGRLSGSDYTSYKNLVTEPVGRPPVHPSTGPEPITVCSKCLAPFGRGKQHVCTREAMRKNKEDLVWNSSDKSKQKIVSSQLKEIFEEAGASTKGGEVKLRTYGTPLTVSMGKSHTRPHPYFSNESINKLQLKMGETRQ